MQVVLDTLTLFIRMSIKKKNDELNDLLLIQLKTIVHCYIVYIGSFCIELNEPS